MTKVLTEDGFLFGQNSAAECDSRSRPETEKQENEISRSMVQHFKNNLTILRFPGGNRQKTTGLQEYTFRRKLKQFIGGRLILNHG